MKFELCRKYAFFLFEMILKNRKRYLVLSVLLIIVEIVIQFINLIFSKMIIDSLGFDFNFLRYASMVFFIFSANFFFKNAKIMLSKYVKLYAKDIMAPMTAIFSEKSASIKYSSLENSEIQSKMFKASNVLINSDELEKYLNGINNIIISIIQALGIACIMLMLNTAAAGIVLFISVAMIINNLYAHKLNRLPVHQMSECDTRWKYLQDISTGYTSAKTVRLFNAAPFLILKTDLNRQEYISILAKKTGFKIRTNMFYLIMNHILEGILLITLSISVSKELVSLGIFILFYNCIRQYTKHMLNITEQYIKIADISVYIMDFFNFMNDMDIVPEEGKEETIAPKGTIEFKNVSFKYPGSSHFALKNISLKIEPGEKVMILGENGSGKTTFLNLLMGFYDNYEGEIYYAGHNIKEYGLRQYLDLFSVIFQDYKTFALNVHENISLKENPDTSLVNKIMSENDIYNKIQSLPYKENTIISKKINAEGVELSGGEKQNLAICRALYRGGHIFIFDEPLAHISSNAEMKFSKKLEEISKSKTSILVSHRIDKMGNYDCIYVFNKGSIVESGSHASLMELKGHYFEMISLQAQFYNESQVINYAV